MCLRRNYNLLSRVMLMTTKVNTFEYFACEDIGILV